MIVSATNALSLGVYRTMQGHMDGLANENAVKTHHETNQAIVGTKKASAGQGMAFVLGREQALSGKPNKQHEAILQENDALRRREITQINAGSIDMSRYIMGVMSGNVEGPMPMSALIARENYERSLKQIAQAA